MREYLVFTVTATLGAMGELAGHERRSSWGWPGRSALLGLLGAALGIRRDGDFSALDGLSVAVAVFDEGRPLRDYHTVQTIPTAKVKRPQSRPIGLREVGGEVNTTITHRDYRTCPLYAVAISGDALEVIAEALKQPVFTLYLGRKSCPLSAPLAPQVIAAASVEAALARARLPLWWPESKRVATRLYSDMADAEGERTETRHDRARDRQLWHFTERRFAVKTVEIRPQRESTTCICPD